MRARGARPAAGAWIRFFRLRLLPTALLNAGTGAIAAGALERPPSPRDATLLGMAIVASYLFGMGGNDWVDRERDRVRAPTRPLPAGEITLRAAAAALVGAGALAAISSALLPARTSLWCAGILLAILLYDGVTKDHSWLGPLAMGGVRALVVLAGASLVGEARDGAIAAIVIGGHGFLTTRYSLEEELARPGILSRRAWSILAHSAAATLLVALAASPPAALLAGWVLPLLYLGIVVAHRAESPPARFTFLSLAAFPLLDGALQLSYNSPVTAAICGAVHLGCFLHRRAS